MDLKDKLVILDKIYGAYYDYAAEMEVACYRGCDSCCTCNVVASGLEGYKIMEYLKDEGMGDYLEKLEAASRQKYYRPQITTNRLAALCIQGEEIPEEAEHGSGACLFLNNKECSIYPVRPFECRSFFSEIECRRMGYAYLPPVYISVANLFKQYIEHLDAGGFSANLIDVLLFYKNGEKNKESLLNNLPVQTPLVPPDHLPKIQSVLMALRKIFIKKGTET